MTTNIDLENMAKKYKIPLNYVVFKDELKKLPSNKELYIIINMSSTGHPGTHWVSLFYSPTLRLYYDPFGVKPPVEVIDFCDKRVIYNDIQDEDIDGTNCGQLSLNFLRLVSNSLG